MYKKTQEFEFRTPTTDVLILANAQFAYICQSDDVTSVLPAVVRDIVLVYMG